MFIKTIKMNVALMGFGRGVEVKLEGACMSVCVLGGTCLQQYTPYPQCDSPQGLPH